MRHFVARCYINTQNDLLLALFVISNTDGA